MNNTLSINIYKKIYLPTYRTDLEDLLYILRKKQSGLGCVCFQWRNVFKCGNFAFKTFSQMWLSILRKIPLFSLVSSFSDAIFEYESRFKSPKTTIQTQYHLFGGEIQPYKALSHPFLLAFRLNARCK